MIGSSDLVLCCFLWGIAHVASLSDKQEKITGALLQSDALNLNRESEDSMGRSLTRSLQSDANALINKSDEMVRNVLTLKEPLRLACSLNKGAAKVDTDLGFVQSLTIDPTDDACRSLAKSVKYLSGGDAVFQADEMDDAVSFLVITAGKDSQLESLELKKLNDKLKAKDTNGDGTLGPAERNALMSEWQKSAGFGRGELAKPGAPMLLPVGNLQLCDIRANTVDSLSALHYSPHLPFVQAVEIDTGETCDELMKTVLCFAGPDMLFQTKEMDALVAVSVITAGDLKLDQEEMQTLIKRLSGPDAAGKDMVFQREELMRFLGTLQAKLVFDAPVTSDVRFQVPGTTTGFESYMPPVQFGGTMVKVSVNTAVNVGVR